MIYSETLIEFELGSVNAVVKAEADGKFSPQAYHSCSVGDSRGT